MKIAVLFRGPLRPNPMKCMEYMDTCLDQFRATGHEIVTYLVTWRNFKEHRAAELLALDKFDNVIMLTEPSKEQIARCTTRPRYDYYETYCVYYMYYQNKTAWDIICNADQYDYVVNGRTDLWVDFGPHLNEWFDPDYYVSPENNAPWINDWIGVATPENMQKSWNFGNYQTLGHLIDNTNVSEHILMTIQDHHGVKRRTAPLINKLLDPDRHNGDTNYPHRRA